MDRDVLADAGMDIDPLVDAICDRIIACAIAVHTALGPGLLESIYRDCLIAEMLANGLNVEWEVPVPVNYRGRRVRDDLRLDILVEGKVVVEVKAVSLIHPVHKAQLITYLKLSGKPGGLILNFNGVTLKSGLRRVDHPEIYAKKHQHS
jgi:GxxExxY protein